MDNPYLDQFNELQEQNTFKGQQWFGKRQALVEKYSWAVPNEEVLVYLSEFGEIYELGAGSGYWANCIESRGDCTVHASDVEAHPNPWTEVQRVMAHELFDDIEDEPVLMVWPPTDSDMAFKVAGFGEPSHILYVGEPRGGCTATDQFFDVLDEKYGLVAKIDIPSYEGVNDNFFHYVRKV